MSIVIEQDWVHAAALQELLTLLCADGEEARVAGGAVRNALLDEAIKDVDIATTRTPQDVTSALEAAGHRTIPTGIEHGTVTALVDGETFEVTTLRSDVETDGRHAKVVFGKDWTEDARRRDFTMNALYMDATGKVFDPLGGYDDLMARQVKFIDDPSQRIREDYLRILRFFRFFAWYGSFRPDAEGLKACVRLKSGLEDLSVERIWHELSRLLAAPDPTRSILWMRQTGVLTEILPESEKWGIDALPGLVEAEQKLGWEPDAVLRIMAIVPSQEERMRDFAKRLKLSNKVRDRLVVWAKSTEPDERQKRGKFEQALYRGSVSGIEDRLRLAIAGHRAKGNKRPAKKLAKRLQQLLNWQRPVFPVRGQDLLNSGHEPGPKIADALTTLEERWIESQFMLSKEQLLVLL